MDVCVCVLCYHDVDLPILLFTLTLIMMGYCYISFYLKNMKKRHILKMYPIS